MRCQKVVISLKNNNNNNDDDNENKQTNKFSDKWSLKIQ